MSKKTWNKRMGRRRFLATLSGLGISTAALAGMSQETLATLTDDPEKEVPRLKAYRHTNHEAVVNDGAAPEREPIYYTIPRDEWIQVEAPFKAAKSLSERFSHTPQISVGVSSVGDGSNLSINVNHITHTVLGKAFSPKTSVQELKEGLPTEVDGTVSYAGKEETVKNIPVNVRKIQTEYHTQATDFFYYNYRPVPAGCAVHSAGYNDDGDLEAATLTTPAYDSGTGKAGWICSGHQVDWQSGNPVYQRKKKTFGGNKLGKSTRTMGCLNCYNDAAFIESNGTKDRKYDFAADAADSYMGWFLWGTLAMDKMKDLEAAGTDIIHQGGTSKRNKGPILDISADEEQMIVASDSSPGDSGGPYFYLDQYDEAYMCGIHSRGWDEDGDGYNDDAFGTTMQHIENTWPVYV